MLFRSLSAFDYEGLPGDAALPSLAKSLGQTILDINDYQSMLMVQMGNVFIQPLQQFASGDLLESKELAKKYHRSRQRYDSSVIKFGQTRKNDFDRIPEAEAELMLSRRAYQEKSLEMVSMMARLEAESKLQVIERAAAFLYSEKAFFSQGEGDYS